MLSLSLVTAVSFAENEIADGSDLSAYRGENLSDPVQSSSADPDGYSDEITDADIGESIGSDLHKAEDIEPADESGAGENSGTADNKVSSDRTYSLEMTDRTDGNELIDGSDDSDDAILPDIAQDLNNSSADDDKEAVRGGTNTYDIYTVDDLSLIDEDPYGKFTLRADLDLSGTNWVPLCSGVDGFHGDFNGSYHTISGINCAGTGNDRLGLFDHNAGTIRALTIEDSVFEGPAQVIGAVAARNTGTIDTCNVDCVITGSSGTSGFFAGGITGANLGEINNCTFSGEISVEAGASDSGIYAGGIASSSIGPISDCRNEGDIEVNSSREIYAGGIVGYDLDLISNCWNTGSVYAKNTSAESDTSCGGIAGVCASYFSDDENHDSIIELCSNEGDIEAYGRCAIYAGGIAGNMTEFSSVQDSANFGEVVASVLANGGDKSWAFCGGIAGNMADSAIMYCYNTGRISSDSRTPDAFALSGGLTGAQTGESSIGQCYNTGKVSALTRAGGICGENSSYIVDCYNTGLISVSATGDYVGGITGGNFGEASVECVYNVGKALGGIARGGISGFNQGGTLHAETAYTASYATDPTANNRTYQQMMSANTFAGFTFNKIWGMSTGLYKFPILKPVVDMNDQLDIDVCKCIETHHFGAWKTTKAPTATSLGVDTRTCDICKTKETKTSTPTGAATIRNTIANSAKKTNDVIWDKSLVKGASNYQINWRARGASTWASRNVGNTIRGTTSGLTIGTLYEIRVRPYAVDTVTKKSTYGSWSNTVYRYFHTTEKIRLASKSKGTFTMSWKVNPNATSYQVLYTTNKNGSGAANNIKTAGKGAGSITVKDIKVNGKTQKLKSGTTYYVQVREIRKVGNTNYIGNISIPVAVKVK